MALSDSKKLPISDKYVLVSFTAKKYIAGADISSLGSDVYTADVAFNPKIIEQFIVRMSTTEQTLTTLVDFDSVASSGDYGVQAQADGTYTIKFKTNGTATPSHIRFNHRFNMTDGIPRELPQDPTSGSGEKLLWESRVKGGSGFTQSIKNLVSGGVYTLAGSDISIENVDNEFKKYLTATDSFRNQNVTVWAGINADIVKLYTGKIARVSVSGDKFTLGLRDGLGGLNAQALLGDTLDEGLYDQADSIAQNFRGTPNRLHIGNQTRAFTTGYRWGDGTVSPFIDQTPGARSVFGTMECLSDIASQEAVCIDRSGSPSTTTSRTWSLGRRVNSIDTISEFVTSLIVDFEAFTTGGHHAYLARLSNVPGAIAVGDTVKLSVSGNDVWAIYLGSGVFEQDFESGTNAWAPWGAAGTKTVSFRREGRTRVTLYTGSTQVNLLEGRHYTINETATSGGNIDVTIVLDDDIENSILKGEFLDFNGNVVPIHPDYCQIYFQTKHDISVTDNTSHEKIVQLLLESAGASIDSASFTAAASALTAKCRFSIPYVDQGGYGLTIEYLEDLLSSVAGYIYLNEDGDMEYHLYDTIASSSTEVDSDTIMSHSVSVSYDDLVRTLSFENPHTEQYVSDETDDTVFYIHGVNRTRSFRHVLESYTGATINARKDLILAIRNTANYESTIRVKTILVDSVLGSSLSIDGKKYTGLGTIVSMTKTGKDITIKTSSQLSE